MAEIRHGEPGGWVAGCRESCCREAIYAYNRKRNSDIAIGGEQAKRLVDATGTKRRVQALMLMGWLAHEIATALGMQSTQAVTNLLARSEVRRDTAERVKVVYRKMWRMWLNGDLQHLMDDPMRQRGIRQAVAKGWLPGAVWDEIDNPKEKPRGLAS
jgi:plasmid maintenance system antidote protein VapI